MKIKSLSQLKRCLLPLRRAGKRIVFANGCFDILHMGHITTLREAKRLGDVLIVAVNSDGSVRRLKGANRPFIPEKERTAILASLEMVDYVILFPDETPLRLIRQLEPDVLVKGNDYEGKEVVGQDVVEARGGKVVLIPIVPRHSTTLLVEKIRRNLAGEPARSRCTTKRLSG